MALGLRVLDVELAQAEQGLPLSREGPRERQREHAVIEELDAQLEAVDVGNVERHRLDDDRRDRVLQVRRRGGLGRQAGVNGAAADGRAERGQVNLFGDVEQVERGDSGGSDRRHLLVAEVSHERRERLYRSGKRVKVLGKRGGDAG